MGIIKLLILTGAFAWILYLVAKWIPRYFINPAYLPPQPSVYVASGDTNSVTIFNRRDDQTLDPNPFVTLHVGVNALSPECGLWHPFDVAVTADGDIFTLSLNSGEDSTTIALFRSGAAGAQPPDGIYATDQVAHATGLALSRVPISLMATHVDQSIGVVELDRDPINNNEPRGGLAGGNTTFVAPLGIATDPASGTIYVAEPTRNAVLAFAVYHPGQVNNRVPSRTISGAATNLDLPQHIAVDAQGQIYVTNAGNNCICIFATDADQNAAPLRTIGGPNARNTSLNRPTGIAVDNFGQIYVGNGNSLLVFAGGTNAADADPFPTQRIDATPANLLGGITGVSFRVPPR